MLLKKHLKNTDKKYIDFLNNVDFEMAKALIKDWDKMAIRVAKMILAHEDINNINIKIN